MLFDFKRQAMISAQQKRGGEVPEAIDFDGANDYLSRPSDLIGNADGKTFTFSCWLYLTNTTANQTIYAIDGGGVYVKWNGSELYLRFSNSSYVNVVATTVAIPLDTWVHLAFSFDVTNVANRHVYVDDAVKSVTWTTYNNDTINFTETVGPNISAQSGGQKWTGRLAHVYLDYTYRDLSVEANRRLFITSDLKPADNQSSLSPIIYLPMTDSTAAGTNLGTGGDFTINGTVSQSSRGPNQHNAAASTFDGSADKVTRSSITGLADGKQATVSFNMKLASTSSGTVFGIAQPATNVWFLISVGAELVVIGKNASGADVIRFDQTGNSLKPDRWYNVSISFDLTNVSNRHIIIDGVEASGTWTTYTNDNIDFTRPAYSIGDNGVPGTYYNGELSEFYFDTTYIDLSASNPFYDTETGKPKDLGIDGSTPTGSAPLIYLPLRGDDAGSNKGTGGDFTVNSGPFTGARGPSEYWAESAEFNGTNQYLRRTSALSGITNSKQLTIALSLYFDTYVATNPHFIFYDTINGRNIFSVVGKSGTNELKFEGRNGPTTLLDVTVSGTMSNDNWINIIASFDLSNTSNRHIFRGFSGTAPSSTTPTWTTYVDDTLSLTDSDQPSIGGHNASQYHNGKIGFLWMDTSYIDLSQEANRLKFFDAFGYPVDLGADGSLPTGSQPLIYMNKGFHLGTNLGSGGNFTPQNAPTDGGFVKG